MGVLLAKRRRRLVRRQAQAPRDQVTGAWAEVRDALVDHGSHVHPSTTRQETALLSGVAAATTVAVLADTAQYSVDPVSDSDALRAWSEVHGIVEELGKNQTRWQRIRSGLSVKSFGLSWASFTAWLGKRR
jgi:uncharacterized protein YmfQ (DUF2313 family)